MPDQYQTVLTSLIAAAVLTTGLLTYRYIYPRKNIPLFTLMLLISFLPLISILRYGAYESGDFNIHAYRSIAFFDAIKDGQIMPSWPKDLNATYGYPLFVILNSLPYYIISFFHVIGFSFIMSTKLLLVFSYIFSGIAFWFFARKQSKNELAVFAGTIFYLFAPYHFVDLHFRAAVGETLSFAVLPVFMLSIQLLWEKRNVFYTLVLGSFFGIFILSHHAIAVFSLGLGVTYVCFLALRKGRLTLKLLFLYLASVFLGLSLSLYVWFPHIAMAKYTYGALLQTVDVSFPGLAELFFSPWVYGFLYQGPDGQLSFLIGYLHICAVFVSTYLIATNRINLKSQAGYFLVITLSIVFMMTPLSNSIWETIPLIRSVQFSTRLLVLMAFSTSMLVVFVAEYYKKSKILVWAVVIFTVLVTVLNWGQRRVIPEIDDNTLRENLWASTAGGEGFYGLGMPKWVRLEEMWFDKKPLSHLEILDGIGSAELKARKSNLHTYQISAETNLVVKENTLYFPGWSVYSNNVFVPINPSHPDFPGVITFSLPKGEHVLELEYADIGVLRSAKTVSVVTALFVAIFFLRHFLKKKFKSVV